MGRRSAINRENAPDVVDEREGVGPQGTTPPDDARSQPARIDWDLRAGPILRSIEAPTAGADDHDAPAHITQPPAADPTPAPAGRLAALRLRAEKRLILSSPEEPFWKRGVMLLAALFLAGLHLYFTQSFWAPAYWGWGNNQNGYLVGARNLAKHGTTGFTPTSPLEFVGWMWVMGDGASTAPGGGVHYPKYPLGVPLVDAVVYRIATALHDEATAVGWVYRVSPISMSLALLGMFFIGRLLANSFAGLLAMILLATCPLALILANNPNSHALALCFIIWGFYFLLRWWQSGTWLLGLAAGFMLGYALTIRYTEGLLLMPLALAGLLAVTYRAFSNVAWWRVAVWVVFVAAALMLNDSAHGPLFQWEQWIGSKLGTHIAWWQRTILVILPILLTIRWSAIDRVFSRDSFGDGEWVRTMACALVVIAATCVELPELGPTTPLVLHTARLAALLAAFCGSITVLYAIEWRLPPTWLPSGSLALGWIVPVVGLVTFNRLTVGVWTGYDTTNESTGFTWDTFVGKWGNTADQLYNQGLYFVLPVGVLGLLLAFRWSWRAAAVLMLWFLPGTLLYMAYYYGRGMPLIGYLRFFTSMLPPVVLGTVWLIYRATESAAASGRRSSDDEPTWWRRGSFAVPVAAGLFVALPSAVNLNNTIGAMERDHVIATNLSDTGRRTRESVPANSVVFGHSQRLLNYLQFAGADYKLYGSDYFQGSSPVPPIGNPEPGQPNPIQSARRDFLRRAYGGLDRADLVRAQNQVMSEALAAGTRVFLVMDSPGQSAFRRGFIPSERFDTAVVQKWTEPARMSSTAMRTISSLGADMSNRSSPQTWSIVEVKSKPAPATAPAPQAAPPSEPHPTTAPTTQPFLFRHLRRG